MKIKVSLFNEKVDIIIPLLSLLYSFVFIVIKVEDDCGTQVGIYFIVLLFSPYFAICPEVIKNIGTYTPMCYYESGEYHWDYNAVKNAIKN